MKNGKRLVSSIDELSELRIRIARVLERWQFERAGLDIDSSEQQVPTSLIERRARHAQLGEHIEQLKAAVQAQQRHAARCASREHQEDLDAPGYCMSCHEPIPVRPPPGQVAHVRELLEAEPGRAERGAGGAGASDTHCDQCGGTLGMVDDGTARGAPARRATVDARGCDDSP